MSNSSESVSQKIHFHCTGCKHSISVPPGLAGRKCRCPRCNAVNDVPELEVKLDDSVMLEVEDEQTHDKVKISDEPPKHESPARKVEAEKVDSAAPIEIMPASPTGMTVGRVGKGIEVYKAMRPPTRAREVRSFVAKLREDMNDPMFGTPHNIEIVDDQINEFLEKYPNYDVTHTNIIVGEMFSKKGNDNVLVVNVWFKRRDAEAT